ncbi:TPA: leucyl aminopeptidase family protein [Staphylococcus argenteus]|uniref:M17 family metallopeptidase n=1 Tax=Staphylococcus argenteus TaxID=985002 RepID=UPI0004FF8040|nr:leucyl aminopeptidase family protein [Staphylococcus argenteus]MDT3006335.1 leucyl aminopeptidase family protein [Staphylococcus argenteus]UPO21674.1 leucyl aminopeptidase family protein [Staphylococcus argenteus]CDR63025.1 cytosol aminopeptidase [Staphylococcus argenteus]HDY9444902.1 leucyl aminopeptidase family protein [Staphylococcus argenteus]HDY9493256.1 leucyl aminopeptidase family protein [Staphylococcus argenteus]
MNFKLNKETGKKINTLIVGIPEHLNQLDSIIFNDIDITETLESLKHQHIIGSTVGKIYTTAFAVRNESYRLIAVGLGNLKNQHYRDLLKIWGQLFQYIKQEHINDTYLLMDTFISKYGQLTNVLASCGVQSERATYQFDHYKSNKKTPFNPNIYLISDKLNDIDTINEGVVIGQAINLARDFSNMPPNVLTPQTFAEDIINHFKNTAVKVDIKDDDTLVSEGFGLIHAVGKGSKHKPRLVTITYNGKNDNEAPIALVGKGITYDSGGYSIKTKNGMATMKFDMCGAANVVGIIEAASRLRLPVNIIGVLACAENMINEASMKPDDVFTALSGETVEVLNTDAEGRLVLGDAVYYANQYQPSVIMDFATLTGAAIVALGEDKAAVFQSNSKAFLNDILKISTSLDEMVFELPITETERTKIKQSDVADLVNHTNGQGKALFAASFVTHFSGQTPHIHFDIAGPATTNKVSFNGPKGPTGFMIPTIVDWLRKQ